MLPIMSYNLSLAGVCSFNISMIYAVTLLVVFVALHTCFSIILQCLHVFSPEAFLLCDCYMQMHNCMSLLAAIVRLIMPWLKWGTKVSLWGLQGHWALCGGKLFKLHQLVHNQLADLHWIGVSLTEPEHYICTEQSLCVVCYPNLLKEHNVFWIHEWGHPLA